MLLFLEEVEGQTARFLGKDSDRVINLSLKRIDEQLTVGKWYEVNADADGRFYATFSEAETGKRLDKAKALRRKLKNKQK